MNNFGRTGSLNYFNYYVLWYQIVYSFRVSVQKDLYRPNEKKQPTTSAEKWRQLTAHTYVKDEWTTGDT